MESLLEGLRALPTPARQGRARAVPKLAQRSQEMMAVVRLCKAKKVAERAREAAEQHGAALRGVWDDDRARVGDFVDDASADDESGGDLRAVDGRRFHPNAHPPRAVLKNAWFQVGRICKSIRGGMDSWTQELSAVSTVASAAMLAHRAFVANEIGEMQRLHVSPVIFWHYDCTPTKVFFGRAL